MEHYNILDLIPQRPPVVMVDKLKYCDNVKTVSEFVIKAENIFCENNQFQEPGLIENIAQTAAARMGFMVKSGGQKPLIGYIGAIKNLHIHYLPAVDNVLTTTVEVVSEIMGFTVIKGQSFCNDNIAAECEMRIFLTDKNAVD